jgi:peptidoglycan hydrolase-like protein with peptidoglycan-binding domain
MLEAPHTGADVRVVPLSTTDLLPTVVRPVADLTLPIKPGTTGWSVTQLQQALDRHGSALSVDGGYGPSTESAVEAWQRKHELHANGVVHLDTWLTLG